MPRMIRMTAGIGSNTPSPVLTEVSREVFDGETARLEANIAHAQTELDAHLSRDDIVEQATDDTPEVELETLDDVAEREAEDE